MRDAQTACTNKGSESAPIAGTFPRSMTQLATLLFLASTCTTPLVRAAVWENSTSGTDLWYSGFLHAEASYTNVTGSVAGYEEGYFHGQDGISIDVKGALHAKGSLRSGLLLNSTLLFDTRYKRYPQRYWDRRFWDTFRMKVVMDTPHRINDRWKFHARAVYDRDDTWRDEYPDARLLMEPIDDARLEVFAHLESRSVTVEAGDLKPDYGGLGFVLYQRDILGLHSDIHNEAASAGITTGRVKGTTFLQTPDDSLGIRADGTAGPYHLAHAPIVRGSEIVYIEVRDRFDPSILIRRTQQRRNIDYTIDYLRGVVTFTEPVQSETFEGNPVYISVQYSFDDRDAGYRRYLAATRADVKLGERVSFGGRYAGVFDDAGSWRGDETNKPPAQRLSAYGAVLQADLMDHTRIEAAAALSDSGHLGGEASNAALGVRLECRDVPRLRLKGEFQRIEYGFEPLDNRSFVGQRNRQIISSEGTYAASSAVDLIAGQRHVTAANPQFDANSYTDETVFAGLAVRPAKGMTLKYKHEWRSAIDDKSSHEKEEYRETSLMELELAGSKGKTRIAAERELFLDQVHKGTEGASTATWRLRSASDLRFGTLLRPSLVLKTELRKDRDSDMSLNRRDMAEAEVNIRKAEILQAQVRGEWAADYDIHEAGWHFTGGERVRREYAYVLSGDLRPTDSVQLIATLERQETYDDASDAVERKAKVARCEGYWFINPDLELHAAFSNEDLEDTRKIGVSDGLLHRYETRFESDLTYNADTKLSLFAGYQLKIRRLFYPDLSDTRVNRIRLGINAHLTRRLEITARVRYTSLTGESVAYSQSDGIDVHEDLENHRWIATGELAYDLKSMWRVAAGYESLEYAVDSVEDSQDDYSAGRIYLKVMQKF